MNIGRTRAQGFWLCALVAFGVAVLGGMSACERRGAGVVGNPRVVVLGFAGIDSDRLDAYRAAGKLPNIDALIREGDGRRLATTSPVVAPVTWTSFSTGLGPAEHGVFGVVRRDPSSYAILDGAQTLEGAEMVLGFSLDGPTVTSRAHGATFWERADAAGRRAVVLRVPYAFPPRPLEHGRSLSGMGVPDVALDVGAFVELTSLSEKGIGELPGIEVDGWSAPPIPISFARDGRKLRIRLGERQILLGEGVWSEPQGIVFDVSPFHSVAATVRLYARSIEPEVRIYVSAPNLDPRAPEFPISTPEEFAPQLAKQVGLFDTLGAGQPIEAFEADVVDEHGFVGHVSLTQEWARRATLHQIDQRDAELVVSVFTATDPVSRLFWSKAEGDLVEHAYRAMDRIVGDVRRHLPQDARLLVVSTHGFERFERAVSLNAWLEREGLQARSGGHDGLQNVDWSRTRAYAIGLGQVYLNLARREREGIVEPGPEADALLERISVGLRSLRDGRRDSAVVEEVLRGGQHFAGPFESEAPDLLVSFADGYRSAFADEDGGTASEVIETNASTWTGAHGSAAAARVPGVLLSSVPLVPGPASVLDVAPTVLEWLDVGVPTELPGRPLGLVQMKSGATRSRMRLPESAPVRGGATAES